MTVLLASEPLVELLESPRIIDARYGVFFRLHPASIPSMLTGVKGIAILVKNVTFEIAELTDPEFCYGPSFRKGMQPLPDLNVWEWADRFREPSQVASSEPGRWRTDRTPYLRESLECQSPSSPVRKVVFKKSAQVGRGCDTEQRGRVAIVLTVGIP